MKITCCYRCIPNGEVIHTFIDEDTRVAGIMPESFLDLKGLELAEYNAACYNGKDTDWMANCETILLSDNDYALVIEIGTIGYNILKWDGYWKFVETALNDDDKGRWSIKPCPGNFTYIGYRPTKLIQYRACPGIYRLTYDKTNNTVVTNDGILIPEFDVNSLSKISYNYEGYKDAVRNNYYAVVYRDDSPIFLERKGDRLLEINHK